MIAFFPYFKSFHITHHNKFRVFGLIDSIPLFLQQFFVLGRLHPECKYFDTSNYLNSSMYDMISYNIK